MPVTVRKRAECISLLARFPMEVEGVLDVLRRGYPVTTAFSSMNPGISGIDCDLAVEEVSQFVLTRLNLAQGESSVNSITHGNCAGYWKDQPGRPSPKLGGRTAPTCSRGYPGPQTMPQYRIDKTTRQPQSKVGCTRRAPSWAWSLGGQMGYTLRERSAPSRLSRH